MASRVARIAVVTGANQGIGYEIARSLGAMKDVRVIATSRDLTRGRAAVEAMRCGLSAVEAETAAAAPLVAAASATADLDIIPYKLDITDPESINGFADYMKREHGGVVDILVNNAGMAYKGDAFGSKEARETIATNVYGTMAITDALLPFLKASSVGARIVNVCSMAGKLSQVSPALQAQFQDPRATPASITRLMEEFIEAVGDGTYAAKGWPKSMYGVSKLGEIAYTYTLARDMLPFGIVVNACCPGYCSTRMSSHKGPRPAAKGAETPVWLATREGKAVDLTGGFYQDMELLAW